MGGPKTQTHTDSNGHPYKTGEHISEQFFDDLIQDKLPDNLAAQLRKGGGKTGSNMARDVALFVQSAADKKEGDNKNVALGITHGETIDSFLYYLDSYLAQNKEGEESAETNTFYDATRSTDYDAGFDVHINNQNQMVVTANGTAAEVSLANFIVFLEERQK